MKIKLILSILLLQIRCNTAQQELPDGIDGSINEASTLYDTEQLSRKIYTGAVFWMHLQSDMDSKAELAQTISSDYPVLKTQLKQSPISSVPAIIASIDSMVSITKEMMMALQTYEDYEAPETVYKTRQLLVDQLRPKYERVKTLTETALRKQEVEVIEKLESRPSDVSIRVKQMFELSSSLRESKKIADEIFIDIVEWIYFDIPFKNKKLVNTIRRSTPIFDSLQSRDLRNAKFAQRSVSDSLISELKNLADEGQSLIKSLESPSDLENPEKRFNAEDNLESIIIPKYSSIKLAMIHAVRNHDQALLSVLSRGQTKSGGKD